MNPTPERTEGGMPRLLRSTHVTPWADRHAIYPADAARSAFEDAATSEYAKEYWAAKLNQALAQNEALRGALEAADKAASHEDTFVSLAASYRVKHAIACGLNLFKTTTPAKA